MTETPETMPASQSPETSLTTALKQEAFRLGFDLAGATQPRTPPRIDRFEQWLADGFAGQMDYMAERADAYRHPRHVLPEVRSLLMLGVNYRTCEPREPGPGQGTVSRYAWGLDYHDVIHDRLRQLVRFHKQLVPDGVARGVVDTAPLLEREFAQLAGLGWIGKNTMLINQRFGSWLFLAALLTTEKLDYDEPFAEDHCGTCRACLDACPTGALVEPHRVDARRCLSYLTIESKEAMPEQFREAAGSRLFGCDACQQACPFNRDTPCTEEPSFQAAEGMNPVELAELFSLDEPGFRERFRHTPLWRLKREGILRNATVVLDNVHRDRR